MDIIPHSLLPTSNMQRHQCYANNASHSNTSHANASPWGNNWTYSQVVHCSSSVFMAWKISWSSYHQDDQPMLATEIKSSHSFHSRAIRPLSLYACSRGIGQHNRLGSPDSLSFTRQRLNKSHSGLYIEVRYMVPLLLTLRLFLKDQYMSTPQTLTAVGTEHRCCIMIYNWALPRGNGELLPFH